MINLHVHSDYSIQDSVIKLPALMRQVKEYNQPAVALTDHASTAGWFQLARVSNAHNIKAIYGNEFYTKLGLGKPKDKTRYHLVVLAKNDVGYRNILKLQDIANDHRYYKPLLPMPELYKRNEGLFVSTACSLSYPSQKILAGQNERAYKYIENLLDCFGYENVGLEFQFHPDYKDQSIINEGLLKIKDEFGINNVIVTCDSHFLLPEDAKIRNKLLSAAWKKPLSEINSSLKSNCLGNDELVKQFALESDFPEMKLVDKMIKNTYKVADLCNYEFNLHPEKRIPYFNKHSDFERVFLKKVF